MLHNALKAFSWSVGGDVLAVDSRAVQPNAVCPECQDMVLTDVMVASVSLSRLQR